MKYTYISVRVGDVEVEKLNLLKQATGMDRSKILRGLVHAVAVPSGNKNNSAQSSDAAHAVVESK